MEITKFQLQPFSRPTFQNGFGEAIHQWFLAMRLELTNEKYIFELKQFALLYLFQCWLFPKSHQNKMNTYYNCIYHLPNIRC